MKRKDILFESKDNEYDLSIQNGDFVIGNSDLQHIHHILEASPGQYRQHPLLGVGIRAWLKGSVTGVEKRDVSLQFLTDGYKVREVEYKTGALKIRI